MTPRLTRRGLFAAGIAAVIGTRATSAAPKAVPGLYAASASTYVSPVSNLTVVNTTSEVDQLSRSIAQLQEALQEVYGLPPVPGTMVEGQVYCERCDEDVFPEIDAVALGDYRCISAIRKRRGMTYDPRLAMGLPRRRETTEVFVNGEPVSGVTELVAGSNGWVIRTVVDFSRPDTWLCETCRQMLYEVRFGNVEVREGGRR